MKVLTGDELKFRESAAIHAAAVLADPEIINIQGAARNAAEFADCPLEERYQRIWGELRTDPEVKP